MLRILSHLDDIPIQLLHTVHEIGSHSVAYDSKNELIVLFGGYDGSNYFSDTWVYSARGNVWTSLNSMGRRSQEDRDPGCGREGRRRHLNWFREPKSSRFPADLNRTNFCKCWTFRPDLCG
ncbi:MAG: hypothetical protein E3J35_04255 [Methanomassiliicoccales archaeon]|nr:MAG: hypothetical protein E3J35_04255 [Methanomassiliicoccales archaeon]